MSGNVTLNFRYEERFCWIAEGVAEAFPGEAADTMQAYGSRLVVLEDGVALPSPHQPHSEIRSLGAGRYSHWAGTVRFATSDNSSPLDNGRKYTLAIGDHRVDLIAAAWLTPDRARTIARQLEHWTGMAVDVSRFLRHERRHAWRLDLEALAEWAGVAINRTDAFALSEDGHVLDACVDDVDQVAQLGGGRWCLRYPHVFFSGRTIANVKVNGCRYVVRLGAAEIAVPLSLSALALGKTRRPVAPALRRMIEDAQAVGSSIQVIPPQVCDGYEAGDYYHFLAGLVRQQGCRRVLEIGTRLGGSAWAMAQGMGSALEKLVTVDIVDAALKLEQFDPRICRIVGDAAADPTVRAVLEAFDYQPIDLLFVDSAHDYPSTLAHFSIFDALLAPRVVVFDDIVLCESMARLWADLTALYGDAAADATWVEPAVRSGECGFGIILRRP